MGNVRSSGNSFSADAADTDILEFKVDGDAHPRLVVRAGEVVTGDGTAAPAEALGSGTSGVVKDNTTTPGVVTEIWSANSDQFGPFRWVIEDTAVFNGDKDPVLKFGYNVPGAGAMANEGSLFWTVEGHYDTGATELMEGHLEGTTNAGTLRRPFTFAVNKANGDVTGSIAADIFNFMDETGVTQLAQILTNRFDSKVDFRVYKAAGAAALTVKADDGAASVTVDGKSTLSSAVVWQRSGAAAWRIYSVGDTRLYFRDDVNGRMQLALEPAVLVSNALLQLNCILQFQDAALFQTTVGAAGAAAALPATPSKYLKLRDNASGSFVIPMYAAA